MELRIVSVQNPATRQIVQTKFTQVDIKICSSSESREDFHMKNISLENTNDFTHFCTSFDNSNYCVA